MKKPNSINLPNLLNLLDFPNGLSNDLILEDGNCQYATICYLDTDSIFWNRAAIITLSKEHETEAASAMMYLLQKESKTLGLWEQQWGTNTPAMADFIKCISAWGRFSNTVGHGIPIEEFWKSYNATIEGIQAEPSFEYTEEGISKPFTQHLVKEDIEQVICFDDEWNEQNFFIETVTEWILFSWGTMA